MARLERLAHYPPIKARNALFLKPSNGTGSMI